jgi:O-antigen/teichoic acid export membrane protein
VSASSDDTGGASAGLLRLTAGSVTYRLVSNAAVALVALLSARQLAPAGRGVLVLEVTLASFVVLICGLGLTTAGRIHLVSPDAPVTFGEYLSLGLVLAMVQFVACMALAALLLPLVDVHLSWAQRANVGLFGASLLVANLLASALNGYGAVLVAAASNAAGALLQLALVVLLVVQGDHHVDTYVAALSAGNGLQIAMSLVALRRRGEGVRPRLHGDAHRRLLRTGTPVIAMDVAQVLTFRVDRYLIGIFLTPAAVGIYSVAATVPETLRLVPLALTQPIFHRLASGSAQIRDYRWLRWASVASTAGLGLVGVALAPWGIRVALGSSYAGAVTPLRILLLAELGMTLYIVDSTFLAAGLKRVKDAAAAATVGLIAVVVADVILIPEHGVVGAAWASVGSYLLTGLVAELLVWRRMRTVP